MSIEQNWNDINNANDADFEALLASAKLSKLQSNGTLQKIQRYKLGAMHNGALRRIAAKNGQHHKAQVTFCFKSLLDGRLRNLALCLYFAKQGAFP